MQKQKKEATIGVRLTPQQYEEFNLIASARYLTASTLGRLLFEMYMRKEVLIKGIDI